MKKILSLLLVVAMNLTLCACESREERELREAQEAARNAEEAYQRALDDYNELQRDIEAYEKAADRLKNAY